MLYTNRNQLTVIRLEKDEESVSMDVVKSVLGDSHSNTIYCERSSGELAGIISTGDVSRAYVNGLDKVCVNKKFVFLYVGEYLKAKAVFDERENINAIPVLTSKNRLLGEYSRWDELLILEYELSTIRKGRIFVCDDEKKIALVRPGKYSIKRQKVYEDFKEYLESQNISVVCIDYLDAASYADKVNLILFVDENEFRACWTLLNMVLKDNDHVKDKINTYFNCRVKISTYFNCRVKTESYLCDQVAGYLKELYDKGVNIVAMTLDVTPYYREMIKRNREKFAMMGEDFDYILPKSMYGGFFDDLYNEVYADEIMKMPIGNEYDGGVLRLKDSKGKYYNVTNGERMTVGQPKSYERSIYFVGPCYIYGHDVEDRNTIESILQKHLCEKGYAVRCVNYGAVGMYIGYNCLPRIATIPLKRGDIIVVDRPPHGIEGVKYLEIGSIMEKYDVNIAWMVDNPMHCNHKVNEVYAEAIYEAVEPMLTKEIQGHGELIQKEENFIRLLYLQRYFSDRNFQQYRKIGSIVMNCNPFTYGHRYLIEQALGFVDFLIIFVVEEDKSSFSFIERISMVREGVADLGNIMVVPSGPFILSQMSFPEYFIKETSEDLIRHTEQDITTFAEKIAPQLGIQYRFVGEEPEDEVTNQYNVAMKKILPKYGIELVEIPRKALNANPISASSVRKCIEEGNTDQLTELIPVSTKRFLGMA